MKVPGLNPENWYFYVGGDKTQAYSTASGTFVPSTDAALQAWMTDGTQPSAVDTKLALGATLANLEGATDQLRPTDATILDGYQTAQAKPMTELAIFKVLFNHENRIRTLESRPTVTQAQFKAFLKSLM